MLKAAGRRGVRSDTRFAGAGAAGAAAAAAKPAKADGRVALPALWRRRSSAVVPVTAWWAVLPCLDRTTVRSWGGEC